MMCAHKDLDFKLAKSERKTLSIYVERDGSLTVRAPKDITEDKIGEILDKKRQWIRKSIAELEELNRTRVLRQFVNGEGFLYLGKSYRLRIEKNAEAPLSLSKGYFVLAQGHVISAKSRFVEYYKENGKRYIPARVELFRKKLGIDAQKIRVMELSNRWASRGKAGLNFHWKLMLAPQSIIDYVIVHELAHFIKADHSPRFWEYVESVMPNYRDKKNWLRANGAYLDI